MKDKMIHIRLDKETFKKLQHLCIEIEVSVQAFVEGLIKDDIKRSKR